MVKLNNYDSWSEKFSDNLLKKLARDMDDSNYTPEELFKPRKTITQLRLEVLYSKIKREKEGK